MRNQAFVIFKEAGSHQHPVLHERPLILQQAHKPSVCQDQFLYHCQDEGYFCGVRLQVETKKHKSQEMPPKAMQVRVAASVVGAVQGHILGRPPIIQVPCIMHYIGSATLHAAFQNDPASRSYTRPDSSRGHAPVVAYTRTEVTYPASLRIYQITSCSSPT